ncbi:hypothetical protein GCM10011609_80240 [Lentzea pudingi]|uniref:Uncharacterized protein n=1 Tax=Lentzea pudingi TaxID=1789439 RepID=A0ABQ2IT10_9PSEU|nr:hypothetical protein GCM10011609_80240 [Lentzea pudingi]
MRAVSHHGGELRCQNAVSGATVPVVQPCRYRSSYEAVPTRDDEAIMSLNLEHRWHRNVNVMVVMDCVERCQLRARSDPVSRLTLPNWCRISACSMHLTRSNVVVAAHCKSVAKATEVRILYPPQQELRPCDQEVLVTGPFSCCTALSGVDPLMGEDITLLM